MPAAAAGRDLPALKRQRLVLADATNRVDGPALCGLTVPQLTKQWQLRKIKNFTAVARGENAKFHLIQRLWPEVPPVQPRPQQSRVRKRKENITPSTEDDLAALSREQLTARMLSAEKEVIAACKKKVADANTKSHVIANLKASGALGDNASTVEKETFYAFCKARGDSCSGSNNEGSGANMRKLAFVEMCEGLGGGSFGCLFEDRAVQRRGLTARMLAEATDKNGSTNYQTIDMLRDVLGETYTDGRRNRDKCVVASRNAAWLVNKALSDYAESLRLLVDSQENSEQFEPGPDFFTQFSRLAKLEDLVSNNPGGGWRDESPEAPASDKNPALLKAAFDGAPLESTGSENKSGMFLGQIAEVDVRNEGVRKSPQASRWVHTFFGFLEQRKVVEVDADGLDGVAGEPDADELDDFEEEGEEEEEERPIDERPVDSTKRGEIGRKLGGTFRYLIRFLRKGLIRLVIVNDLAGRDECSEMTGGPPSRTTCFCNLCPAVKFAVAEGAPDGCAFEWCANYNGKPRALRVRCRHQPMATPTRRAALTELKSELEDSVRFVPEQVKPYYKDKQELIVELKKRDVDVNSRTTLTEAKILLDEYCVGCLTVLGDPTNASHVDAASDDAVFENLCWWAVANESDKPTKARTVPAKSAARNKLRQLLLNYEELRLVLWMLTRWDVVDATDEETGEPEDEDVADVVTASGHIRDPRLFADCSAHATARLMEHLLTLLFQRALLPQSALGSAEIHQRLRRSVLAIRGSIKAPRFQVSHPKNNKKQQWDSGDKIQRFKFQLSRAKRLLRARMTKDGVPSSPSPSPSSSSSSSPAEEEEEEEVETEPLLVHLVKILAEDDPKVDEIVSLFEQFIDALLFLNRWDWETDADVVKTLQKWQQGVDTMIDSFVGVFGDSFSNYLHNLAAGHMYEQMLRFGPLARLCNESVERRNGEFKGRYHCHSQRGGLGHSKMSTLTDWCCRQMLRAFGIAEGVLDDNDARKAETRRANFAAKAAARAVARRATYGNVVGAVVGVVLELAGVVAPAAVEEEEEESDPIDLTEDHDADEDYDDDDAAVDPS